MKSNTLELVKLFTKITAITGVLFIVLGLLGMAVEFPNFSIVIIIGLLLLGLFALPLTMLYRYHNRIDSDQRS